MAKKPAKAKVVEELPPEDADDAADEAPVREKLPPPPPQLSVPAKASCLTFVVLFLAEIVTLVVLWFKPQIMPLSWMRIAIVTLLVFIVPIVVYRAIALWMFDEKSRFPDISKAWQAGLAELQRKGMSLSSAPLFIIVGTGSDKVRRNFMNASDSNFIVDGAPADGAAPISWHASRDAIFLFLNDISWTNAAITLFEVNTAALKAGRGPTLPGEMPAGQAPARKAQPYMGTLMPDPKAGSVSARPQDGISTPGSGPPFDSNRPPANAPQSPLGPSGGGPISQPAASRYLGTLSPGEMATAAAPATGAQPPSGAGEVRPIATKRSSNRLSSQESSQQLQRLEHVCGMLRRRRHPVCPANGILALLPFDMLKAGDQDVAELERAISADMATIYRELQLRCPVTAVVVGMEQERGFRELIRRIGREGATKQRFGQRFDLRVEATDEELKKFTSHVCGSFEDWVYTLFRDEQALSHPGNTALYALLCKVRRTLKTRLGEVLGNGFGCVRQSGKMPLLFSGCYFTATGPKTDRQAFVNGVFAKLFDEQEDIEWTVDALRENQRRGLLTRVGWGLCAAIFLVVAGLFILDKFVWT